MCLRVRRACDTRPRWNATAAGAGATATAGAFRELEFKHGAAVTVQLEPEDAVEAADGVRAQEGEEYGTTGAAVPDAERAWKRERLVPLHGVRQ
jgi:hypothetical protein